LASKKNYNLSVAFLPVAVDATRKLIFLMSARDCPTASWMVSLWQNHFPCRASFFRNRSKLQGFTAEKYGESSIVFHCAMPEKSLILACTLSSNVPG